MLYLNRIKPKTKEPEKIVTKVKVIKAELQPFSIFVESNGKVEAMKMSQISAEVSGKVLKISDKLQVGEVIEAGGFIAEIDKADYITGLANAAASFANAESSVADAMLALVQEEARADQNIREWKRLGKGKASDLVARVPQLKSAKARLDAAKAAVIQAEEAHLKAGRDLDNTIIRAPYTIKVDRKYVEQGNFIMPGGRVLDGHSDGDLQVRLPITLSEYLLIRDKSTPIELTANLGGSQLTWKASFLRDEGVVDQSTLTIPIVAKIKSNNTQENFQLPPVGLFIDAKIKADERDEVIVLPREAVQLGGKVLLVDTENKLRVRQVNVVFTNKLNAIVSGVEPGDQVVVSPLETPVDGMSVEIVSEPQRNEQ